MKINLGKIMRSADLRQVAFQSGGEGLKITAK